MEFLTTDRCHNYTCMQAPLVTKINQFIDIKLFDAVETRAITQFSVICSKTKSTGAEAAHSQSLSCLNLAAMLVF